jgi:hypothetical protein
VEHLLVMAAETVVLLQTVVVAVLVDIPETVALVMQVVDQ